MIDLVNALHHIDAHASLDGSTARRLIAELRAAREVVADARDSWKARGLPPVVSLQRYDRVTAGDA